MNSSFNIDFGSSLAKSSGTDRKLDPFQRLCYELSKLPGIGDKTATRLAYFLTKNSKEMAEPLAQALIDVKNKMTLCPICFHFTDQPQCSVCSDPRRNLESLCIVEKPIDLIAIEKTGMHRGIYHVLHGALSPLDGIGPEQLKITELLNRLKSSSVKEVLLALNLSIEGEATTVYLSRLLSPLGVSITQLAHGIPIGSLLEYTDRDTLARAIENRVRIPG